MSTLASTPALAGPVNFDDLKTGAPPPGWTATKTGKGEAKWKIIADASAPSKPNVLRQSGEATYPVCIKDGFVEVKFKPISGKGDQAGGLIWRCIIGKRTEKKRFRTKLAPSHRHTLWVDFHDHQFTVTFDLEKAIEWTDHTLKD